MKISTRSKTIPVHSPEARRGDRGFLVIALMAIVAIMLLYLNINLRQLGNLRRELKGVEQRQIQRQGAVAYKSLVMLCQYAFGIIGANLFIQRSQRQSMHYVVQLWQVTWPIVIAQDVERRRG